MSIFVVFCVEVATLTLENRGRFLGVKFSFPEKSVQKYCYFFNCQNFWVIKFKKHIFVKLT